MNTKKIILINLQHILFWIIYIGVNILLNIQFLPINLVLKRLFFVVSLNVIVYYLCYKKLASNYLFQKLYLKFYVFTILLLILSCSIRLIFEPKLIYPLSPFSNKVYIFLIMVIISQSLVAFVASMLSISNETLKLDKKLVSVKLEKKEADLNVLKSKINPHFLLNTLNNIYSISYAENSKTAGAILQLSQLLQYTIYDIDKNKIPLQKEIDTIYSLIGLHQLKYSERLNIDLKFPLENEIETIEIPSMIIFTLVENAIKHSAIGVETNAAILTHLKIDDKQLYFTITNTIAKQAQHNLTEYKGFGLKGLNHLLEEQYPNAHELKIINNSKNYTTTLLLNL